MFRFLPKYPEKSVSYVRVADVDLAIECNKGGLDLGLDFMPALGQPKGRLDIKLRKLAWFDDRHLEESHLTGNVLCWDIEGSRTDIRKFPTEYRYDLLKYNGFLAGLISEDYTFCHGAGICVGDKGIVLVGSSGSGKSTLVSMLEGKVLGDDTLMISTSDMQTIGRFVTITDVASGNMRYFEHGVNRAKLHYVFKLNNLKDPDYVHELRPEISEHERQCLGTIYDDKMDPALRDAFDQRMQRFRWQQKVFEIGTKRDPKVTKRVIEDIISQSVVQN